MSHDFQEALALGAKYSANLIDSEIPQYVPGAAYRQLEFLLGRISSLEQIGDYTTQTGNFTGVSSPLRRGT
jgi:carboxypeptidase D